MQHARHVVDITLPICSLDLTKSEYDTVMLLYNIALEVTEPPKVEVPPAGAAAAGNERGSAASHTTPSAPHVPLTSDYGVDDKEDDNGASAASIAAMSHSFVAAAQSVEAQQFAAGLMPARRATSATSSTISNSDTDSSESDGANDHFHEAQSMLQTTVLSVSRLPPHTSRYFDAEDHEAAGDRHDDDGGDDDDGNVQRGARGSITRPLSSTPPRSALPASVTALPATPLAPLPPAAIDVTGAGRVHSVLASQQQHHQQHSAGSDDSRSDTSASSAPSVTKRMSASLILDELDHSGRSPTPLAPTERAGTGGQPFISVYDQDIDDDGRAGNDHNRHTSHAHRGRQAQATIPSPVLSALDRQQSGSPGLDRSVSSLDSDAAVLPRQRGATPVRGHNVPQATEPSTFRHLMALRLSIQRASICMTEDHVSLGARSPSLYVPKASHIAQSYVAELEGVALFMVAMLNNQNTTYMSSSASDVTLREYQSVVTSEHERATVAAVPLLYKTLATRSTPVVNRVTSDMTTDAIMFSSPSARLYDSALVFAGRPIGAAPPGLSFAAPSAPMPNEVGAASPKPVFRPDFARDRQRTRLDTQVLLINVVLKLDLVRNVRDIMSTINLRALTLNYIVESQWMTKLTEFFTVRVAAAPSPTVPAATVVDAFASTPRQPPSLNSTVAPAPALATVGPAAPAVSEDVVKLFVNGFDCAIDYNPLAISSRLILLFDKVRLTTNILTNSPILAFKIDVRDGSLWLIDKSPKMQPQLMPFRSSDEQLTAWSHGDAPASPLGLRSLYPAILQHLESSSVSDHLDQQGFARIGTLDFVEAFIKQNSTPTAGHEISTALYAEITNGLLTVLTCADSFQTLIDVVQRFSAEVTETYFPPLQRDEVAVSFSNAVSQLRSDASASSISTTVSAANARPSVAISGAGLAAAAGSGFSRWRSTYDDDDDDVKGPRTAVAVTGPVPAVIASGGDTDTSNAIMAALNETFLAPVSAASTVHDDDGDDFKRPRGGVGIQLIDDYHPQQGRSTASTAGAITGPRRPPGVPPPSDAWSPAAPSFAAVVKASSGSKLVSPTAAAAGRGRGGLKSKAKGPQDAARPVQFASDVSVDDGKHGDDRRTHRGKSNTASSSSKQRSSHPHLRDRRSAAAEDQYAYWYPTDPSFDPDSLYLSPSYPLPAGSPATGGAGPVVFENHMSLPDEDQQLPDFQLLQEELKDKDLFFPTPISETLLKDFNICWRLFGGSDWGAMPISAPAAASAAAASGSGAPAARVSAPPTGPTHQVAGEHGVAIESSYFGHAVGHHRYDRDDALSDDFAGVAGVSATATASARSYATVAAAAQARARRPDLGAGRGDHRVGPRPPVDRAIPPPSRPSAPAISPKRRTDQVMECYLTGATVRTQSYDPVLTAALFPDKVKGLDGSNRAGGLVSSRIAVAIKDIELHDLLAASLFKKFLCYYRVPGQPGREIHSCMLRLEWDTVRPELSRIDEEIRLRVELLPLRLNIDQDALEFLLQFFGIRFSLVPDPATAAAAADTAAAAGAAASVQLDTAQVVNPSVPPVFIQKFSTRGFKVCVDYTPKRVDFSDLRDGNYLQLVHMFPLEDVEIDVAKVTLHGLNGWPRLGAELANVWANDIASHQSYKYVTGVQPIRSLVNVGAGVADLVLVPLAQYKRDGKVARGVRKGAESFVRRVATETVGITARLAVGATSLLETVDSIFSSDADPATFSTPGRAASSAANQRNRRGGPGRQQRQRGGASGGFGAGPAGAPAGSDSSLQGPRRLPVHKLAAQPRNVQDGFQQAYDALSRAFQSVAHSVVVVPREEYVRSGTGASVKSVLRAVPRAILRPMIGASEAMSKALLGVQNAVDPRHKLEADDRYKGSN